MWTNKSESIWEKETIEERAHSIINSRLLASVLILLVAAMMLVAVVLLGVMIGRQDPDVSNAVRHLFVRVDSERLPLLPAHYPGTGTKNLPPDVMIVVGDSWAAGLGVADTASDSWWAQLRASQLPDMAVIRATNSSVHSVSLGDMLARTALPSTLQNRRIAIVVQCGWNDLIDAQMAGQLDVLDIHLMADSLVASIKTFAAQAAFQRAAQIAIYLVDYPDASAHTGFTGIVCEQPLDRIYNHAAAVGLHLRALDMYSQALLGAAHNNGYAFIPLRETLAGVGAPEAMHGTVRIRHRPVGVDGHSLDLPVPAAFTSKCGAMNSDGQRYQADLIAAHFLNQAYFIVG